MTSPRARRRLTAALGAALGLGILPVGTAGAGPALITTRPAIDPETDELTFFVGGFNDGGRSLKASSLDLLIDGQRSDSAPVTQTLSDWSTTSAEGSKTWKPPVSVGLVYLWIEHIPPGVLDGIQSFFQRVPSRTVVYPTVYGRMRQGRARLTAADVSRLGDVPYIEGYRPNLIEAVKLDLADLSADPAPLRVLVIVTDGRDFADPKGEGPGDLAALGRDIRKAGVTPLVVVFPAPDADRAQATANMNDLHDAAGGVLRMLDQPQDLENALESLGQGMADLLRVHAPTPVGWHVFGGNHHVSVRLNVGGGQRLNADVGAVAIGPGRLRSLVLGVAGVLALVAGAAIFVLRKRGGGGGPASDDEEILSAAHDLIRRGASPRRAVEELARNYPESVSYLATMDQELFSDPRYPYFRTRPGRLRMQEIRDLLAKKSVDSPMLDDTLAAILAEAVANRTPPDQAAAMLAARVGADECNAFTGMGLDRLAEALRAAAGVHAVLGTPRARGAVVAIQDTLKTRGGALGIVVAWLVRTGGSGRRGETLRLGEARTLIGLAASCAIRLAQDPTVAAEHAEITLEGSEFAITPLGGPVTVEGTAIDRRRVLTDGETVGIGDGLFIFKSASAGNLSTETKVGGRRTRPAVARRQ